MSGYNGLEEGKVYKVLCGDAVMVTNIYYDSVWGIHGVFMTGERRGQPHDWDDSQYPFLLTYDTADEVYRLTRDEITIEEHPEVFL